MSSGGEHAGSMLNEGDSAASCSQQSAAVVKVFLYSEDDEALEDAALRCLKHFPGKAQIDTLIVALPPWLERRSAQQLARIWSSVEALAEKQLARDFGISDLNAQELQQLVEGARRVRPSSVQINLEYCCVIPPELSAYAEQQNIRLVTHNDNKDIMPEGVFNQIKQQASGHCKLGDLDQWKRRYAARYTIINRVKGLVSKRGYILATSKHT